MAYLKQMPTGTRAAVFGTWYPPGSLRILQGVTSDPALLGAAVDTMLFEAADGLGFVVFLDGEVFFGEAVDGIALGVGDGDVDDGFAGVDLDGWGGGRVVGGLSECPDGEGEASEGGDGERCAGVGAGRHGFADDGKWEEAGWSRGGRNRFLRCATE